MTNEQMERKMEFIVDTLARVAVNDEKHDMRLSRLERIMELKKRTQESIAHTDKRLDALIDIVRQKQNGRSNN
jgi:hypothetical protein